MKKIISTCIALMVSAACSISAFAMEVPTNTTIQDLNGVRQYIKIYTVAPDTDPQSLIDDVFEYDGYTYTYSSMTKEERSYSEKEHHTETVTADTEKSDLSVVLKALSPSIEYDDGEFRGTLYLDHSTISTVASGYTTKSYTVSTTKEIGNLDTNDMAYVPDTTTKNGVTVQLQSVDWQVQGTSLVDDILVPAQYKAVATYAGRASYRAATGYVTTAKYIGDIVAEGIESVTYTVIYTGTPSSIRADYDGWRWYNTVWPCHRALATQKVCKEIDHIYDALTAPNALKDLTTLRKFCGEHTDACIAKENKDEFSFYYVGKLCVFWIRLVTRKGDYSMYLNAYIKEESYQKYFDFLEKLRQSGETNMYGAAPYLQSEFPELRGSQKKANAILIAWIKTFETEEGDEPC